MGQVVVAKLNSDDLAAIFGNGYSSTNQRAVLYIVRLSDGSLIRVIDTGIGSAGAPSGLGTPTHCDSNRDGVYDDVHAPDMRGDVRTFDLSSPTAANWRIAFAATGSVVNGAPLFTARGPGGHVQPIHVRVELARPPTGVSGVMALLGTS